MYYWIITTVQWDQIRESNVAVLLNVIFNRLQYEYSITHCQWKKEHLIERVREWVWIPYRTPTRPLLGTQLDDGHAQQESSTRDLWIEKANLNCSGVSAFEQCEPDYPRVLLLFFAYLPLPTLLLPLASITASATATATATSTATTTPNK